MKPSAEHLSTYLGNDSQASHAHGPAGGDPVVPARWATAMTLAAALILFVLGISPPCRADETCPAFLHKWGQPGSGPGDFYYPYDAACASDGTILVSDLGNGRVQRFTAEGAFLQQWRLGPVGINPYGTPGMMAIDDEGFIYISAGSGFIQKLTLDGVLVTQWRLQQTAPGIVPQAAGIAIGSDGNVFVGEGRMRNIQKFTPDGAFLLRWGTEGQGPGQFLTVHGLAADQAGRIYALDSGGVAANHRVEVFDLDGTYLLEWGSLGSGPSQFMDLDDATVDQAGNVYVSDEMLHRIQKFGPDGTFLCMWGFYGTGDGEFDGPVGLGSDPDGNVCVSDFRNHRVEKFGAAPVPTATVTWGGLKARYR